MDLTEKQIVENYAKQCRHCSRSTLSPHEYE